MHIICKSDRRTNMQIILYSTMRCSYENVYGFLLFGITRFPRNNVFHTSRSTTHIQTGTIHSSNSLHGPCLGETHIDVQTCIHAYELLLLLQVGNTEQLAPVSLTIKITLIEMSSWNGYEYQILCGETYTQHKDLSEKVGASDNNSDLHSEGPRFESRSGH
jgi:hypothetical protein